MTVRLLQSPERRATATWIKALGALAFLAVACLQSGCATLRTPARVGQRVAVPGRLVGATGSTVSRGRSEVIGILTRRAGDTVWIRESPGDSERAFVLPRGMVLAPRLARQRTEFWAVGDSVRVRGERLTSGRNGRVTQTWGVEALQGDTLLLAGTQAHPLEVLSSMKSGTARLERQTRRPHPARALLVGGGLIAGGVLALAATRQSDRTECTNMMGCASAQDLVIGSLGITAICGGLLTPLFAGVPRVGWDQLDAASLPVMVAPGPAGNLEISLRWSFGGS